MKTLTIGIIVIAIIGVIYLTISKPKRAVPGFEESQGNIAQPKEISRKTVDDWERNFTESGLSHHWEFFKPLLRDEILVTTEPSSESDLKLGQSKIGGQPDLPENITWLKEDNGKSLSFIAQINFSQTKAFDKTGLLPTRGLVYFFYSAEQEAWGFDPEDKDKFKEYYFDGYENTLKRTEFPRDLDQYSKFKPCKLSYSSSMSLPNWEQKNLTGRLKDNEQEAYWRLSSPEGEINKLIGHSDNIQGQCKKIAN